MISGGYNRATSHEPRYNYVLIDAEKLNTETNALTFGRMLLEREGDFFMSKGDVYSWSKKF